VALLASTGGLFRTSDGANWAASNSELTGWPILSLLVDPTMPSVVLAGTGGGDLWRSSDGGASWTPVPPGPYSAVTYALAASGARLFAGDDGGVRYSTDHGVTWSITNGSDTGLSIAAAPSDPMLMYVGGLGVQTSTDGGSNWAMSGLGGMSQVTSVAVDPTNPMIAYAGTIGTGVQRTGNGGKSFTPFNMGLTPTNVFSLAVAPDGSYLVAGTDSGLFRWTSGAPSWKLASGTEGLKLTSIIVHPSRAMQLWAGSPNGGVLQSSDGGATWTTINAGIADPFVNVVAVDASSIATLFVGTSGSGIFKSQSQ
jgi:hypothetical protein